MVAGSTPAGCPDVSRPDRTDWGFEAGGSSDSCLERRPSEVVSLRIRPFDEPKHGSSQALSTSWLSGHFAPFSRSCRIRAIRHDRPTRCAGTLRRWRMSVRTVMLKAPYSSNTSRLS